MDQLKDKRNLVSATACLSRGPHVNAVKKLILVQLLVTESFIIIIAAYYYYDHSIRQGPVARPPKSQPVLC